MRARLFFHALIRGIELEMFVSRLAYLIFFLASLLREKEEAEGMERGRDIFKGNSGDESKTRETEKRRETGVGS